MVVALIVLGIALAVSLYFNMFGQHAAATGPDLQTRLDAEVKARKDAEADVEKKRKDTDGLKAQLNELKDELKTTKKKLHEQREEQKGGSDLAKARAEVERSASLQLEGVRAELASALVEIERLRSEGGRPRRPAPAAAVAAPVATEQPAPVREREPAPPVQRVIRELSEADKEKMTRLETEASKSRQKASELERELRKVKARLDTQNRAFTVNRSELDLVKDKFRALEKRLNRTLLERDITRRAIKDLEKKTGQSAERVELTAEEIAQSDKSVEARQSQEAAEEKAREDQRKAAEAQAAAATPSEAPAAAPTTESGSGTTPQPS